MNASKFPFRVELSLAPLVSLWSQGVHDGQPLQQALARVIQDGLARAPELLEPIEDPSVIARHRELIDALMTVVFPPAFREQEVAAALVPFQLRSFYATPSFDRLFGGGDGAIRGQVNVDEQTAACVRIVHAYLHVLRQVYGIELELDYPLIFTTRDAETGLDRHFKLCFDGRFLEVIPAAPLPALTDEARRRLLTNLNDPQVLMEVLPPERFVFRGFTVFRAVDVTDQEVLSALKRDLIDKESIISSARFASLQDRLRTLLWRPELLLGLAAIQGEQVFLLNCGRRIEHSCIFSDSEHYTVADFAGSIYERAVREGEPLIIEDLAAEPRRTPVEDELLEMGLRSMIVAPLHYQDQLIGTLDLGSPGAGDLNAASAMKLREVLPLFSMAVRRSMDELNSRIEAVIKERCTAIHPSVEWRFRKAVLNSIERQLTGMPAELEPIVFEGVYPLYALTDIRGSSTQRNAAIQGDLLDHLRLARDVVQAAYAASGLPILDQLSYRIDRQAAQIETGLRSGDEMTALAFLRGEVEPLFARLEALGPEVRETCQAYRATLDPRLGTVYRRRKDFEESVTLITDTISAFLDGEESRAQAMFPHYFEKQKTDGVEYGIYVGASLVESGQFDPVYLKNLRLWQLMVTCGIARQAERLKKRLKLPLDTTHLILVQHSPLSIRFRFDEKRFDVDGAYNVRYEIVKKRIDKALIRGTSERLTQPGTIAIVYSQPQEAAEYRDYIEYLQAKGYLGPEVKDLELEGLQEMAGLRALRVSVALAEPEPKRVLVREAEAAVQALSARD